MDNEICVVMTTCPDAASAEQLARVLVESRLAACVSLGPEITSVYPWQGRIEREREISLTINTTRGRVDELKKQLVANHPYDVPELLVVPVVEGLDTYLNWIRDWTQ
ncbi:MAG TPA: divalent-cation tolerance protein CutA [Wenzhouxiangella sp.]|nr:divalent-cation tolerance protein CutA [Wenzhouxiangella sp.]